MASEKYLFDTISLEATESASEGLQISTSTVKRIEISPKIKQQYNMDIARLVQYGTNMKNNCSSEMTEAISGEEEIDTETKSVWEHCEPTFKFNKPRQKCKQMKSIYEKSVSNEKKERKLSNCYKLDIPTSLLLEKLMDMRSLGQYHDVIAKSRSSVVICSGYTIIKDYWGIICESFSNAVKIYELSNDENLNKVIYKRTEREFEHMKILRRNYGKHGVPYPVGYHKNIIVMGVIGTSEEPAQQLGSISVDLCDDLYYRIRLKMKQFFVGLQFVHGKLCAENILVYQGSPYYVGLSHSIMSGGQEPKALKKLMKDCCFVTKFFKSRNVPHMLTTEDLFKYVTGFQDISPEVLDVIHKEPQNIKCRGNPNRERNFKAPSGYCRFK